MAPPPRVRGPAPEAARPRPGTELLRPRALVAPPPRPLAPRLRPLTHRAAASVPAGGAVALVGLDLAVLAAEAGWAGARVAALARVGARGLVLTRPVVGAVVQVWGGGRSTGEHR